jgi:hypothetical protein
MGKAQELKGLLEKGVNLQKLINLSSLTIQPLQSDYNYAVDQWQKNRNSQFWSRTAIRCLCAHIEATLFTFRTMAEKIGALSNAQFNKEEMEVLTEQRKVIVKGVETARPKWLQFPDSLKESFRLFAKAVGAEVTIDYGVEGFSNLRKVFDIRNRLMHPKKPFDVQVSAEDLDTADRAIAWFNDTHIGVLDQCHAHLRRPPLF